MEKVTLTDAFDSFEETWSPRVATELNGQAVKLAKLEGEFVWHKHDDADELFWVVDGELTVEFRDRDDVNLSAGELLTVPAGVEHRPVADELAKVALFEPTETVNTGDAAESEKTSELKRLD